jgi:hypothetical protein
MTKGVSFGSKTEKGKVWLSSLNLKTEVCSQAISSKPNKRKPTDKTKGSTHCRRWKGKAGPIHYLLQSPGRHTAEPNHKATALGSIGSLPHIEMRTRYLLFGVLYIWGCSQVETGQPSNTNQQQRIRPFEIRVKNSDYSLGDNWTYVLTDRELKIIYREDVVGSKDTTLLSKTLPANDTLKLISEIDFSQLQGLYSNSCMSDGSRITVKITKDGYTRTAHLANYYRAEVGELIGLLNTLTPDKYKIRYDKEALVSFEKECEEIQ